MNHRRLSRCRRLVPGVLTVLAVLMAVSMPSEAHAAVDCAGADHSLEEIGAPQLRAATLCLLNVERHTVGLPALREDAKLARAARRHSRDMVAHRYFAHDSRSGTRFSTRIARTGWMRGRDRWFVGENLAWGSHARATPRAIVAAWMASPSHRKNIVQRRFRVIGIGVVHGVPVVPAAVGATYTTDFGS